MKKEKAMKTFEKTLTCPLTTDEWCERSERLAAVEREVRSLESRKQQVAADLNAQKKALDAELGALGYQVREHAEMRPVECRLDLDHTAGLACVIRLDTGEVVERRPLMESERQAVLPGVADDTTIELTHVDAHGKRKTTGPVPAAVFDAVAKGIIEKGGGK